MSDEKSEFWLQVERDLDKMIVKQKREQFFAKYDVHEDLVDRSYHKATRTIDRNPRFSSLDAIERETEIIFLAERLLCLKLKKRRTDDLKCDLLHKFKS